MTVAVPEIENPFAMLKRAASGDLEAHRALADEGPAALSEGDLCGFYEALTYARMAAMRGDEKDAGRLMQMLAIASDLLAPDDDAGRIGLAGQFLAITDDAVDRLGAATLGAEAEVHFTALIEAASPEEIEQAKGWRVMLRAAREGEK